MLVVLSLVMYEPCRVTCWGKAATVYSCEALSPSPLGLWTEVELELGVLLLLVGPGKITAVPCRFSILMALSKTRSELFKAEDLRLGEDLADEAMLSRGLGCLEPAGTGAGRMGRWILGSGMVSRRSSLLMKDLVSTDGS